MGKPPGDGLENGLNKPPVENQALKMPVTPQK